MKTDLAHLPEQKQAELKAMVAALIPRYSEIEMIILFGSYARGTWVTDKYIEKGNTYEYKSDYDLLIILSRNKLATSHSSTKVYTDKLKELQLDTPVHPIYNGMDFVNHELQEGNYFFGDIKKEGILLFDSGRYTLADKRELSPLEIQAKAQRDFDNWFDSANGFYRQYTHAINDLDYKIAAFLLHQATERYYAAIVLVFTGYKPKTHDIEDLGHIAKANHIEFAKVFPQVTEEEQRRFELLKKAYIDARYNMDYTISQEDLNYLSQRVQILRNLTERICKEKIESFTR